MEIYDHQPVLLRETLTFWAGKPDGFYVDATLGQGGHSEALLSAYPGSHVLGMDVDPQALEIANLRLGRFGERIRIFKESYMNLKSAVAQTPFAHPDGILADLGASSLQFDRSERGFSFSKPGPLDMRMDPSLKETALDLIRRLPPQKLEQILKDYGEEKFSGPVSRALKKAHHDGRLQDTAACAAVVSSVYLKMGRKREKIHPATRTFQALRIAVNHELDSLSAFLKEAPPLLNLGGRLVCISFHSLEDRLVKEGFRSLSRGCTCPNNFPKCVCGKKSEYLILTKKPVRPGGLETAQNPRSRSAKMRVLERLALDDLKN